MINQLIQRGWADYEVRPAGEVDDGAWCRRVYLDVIGRIPTVEELAEFKSDRSSDRRANLVDRLLHDDQYTEEYARHWSTVWTNLLIGRSGGSDRRSLVSRDGMQKYLRDSFASNKPYNKMVYELVTATGSAKPGTDRFNGAVNFLIDKVNEEKATLATSSTTRIFLGQQVQCTQCHNHPFNQWKQQRFWEFNSFFRQTRGLRRFVDGTNDIDHGELIDQDYAGEANDPEDAMIFYELRNGLTKVAYPKFSDGEKEYEIGPSGFVDEVNRRSELARLMMQSESLDKMIVNRMWSMFMGHGFTRPIDDLGPHNPSTHPELLAGLGEAFRHSSYDLKSLITWITSSRPYQLDATLGSGNESDDPSIGEPPKFSRFYLRQMSAEQLYQSMVTATDASGSGSYEEQERERRRWLQQFVVAFGTDEGDEATTFNGSIPQALMLFNGDLTKNAISTKQGSFLDRLADNSKSPQDAVKGLFLAGLSRRPERKELQIASKLLVAREGDVKEMMQDMWWAIINSNEFILQH
ncbi:DUF1549 domain-containing protein [Rubripirellula obstinata]|nr:DUF1549 domain-containing protein [Rubripirellula obstinata]